MLTEIILAITDIALLAYIGISSYYNTKERQKLLKMIMAKDLRDLTANEAEEKVKPEKNVSTGPDIIPVSPDDPDVFDNFIKRTIKNAKQQVSRSTKKPSNIA